MFTLNVTVPDDGWLWVWVALKPEAWEKPVTVSSPRRSVRRSRVQQLFTNMWIVLRPVGSQVDAAKIDL